MTAEKVFYQSMGQKIGEARQKSKVTQANLGKAVGLSRTSITNIEKGRQPVLSHVLVKIAEALNVGVLELLPRPDEGADSKALKSLKGYDKATQKWVKDIIGQQGDR